MHVLRIWLNSGTQIELLYRGKGDVRTAEHLLNEPDAKVSAIKGLASWVHLTDDFGKDTRLDFRQIAGWQSSDYAAELEGALAIAQAKQEATDKFQREMQNRPSLLVPQGPRMAPGDTINVTHPRNGRIIQG